MLGKTKLNIKFQHDEAALWVLLRLVLSILVAASLVLYSREVQFSKPGGFYEDAFSLELMCQISRTTIHYTTNGNVPTVNSPIYTTPLFQNQNL